MRPSSAFLLLFITLISALFPLDGIAQESDRLVSFPEPLLPHFPMEIRIQSAGAIGSRILVAWGTSELNGENGTVNVLRAQMLRDGKRGEQTSVGSMSARPSGFVQVVAAAASFIVFWNDTRADSPGIYARRFGMDGVPAGGEWRASAGHVDISRRDTLLLFGEPTLGQLMVWPDTRGGSYAIHINPSGAITGSERSMGALNAPLSFRSLPGTTFLPIMNGNVYLVTPDGNISDRMISPNLFNRPYHLERDSSLVLLAEDSLLYFRSFFDSIPSRILPLPIPDSSLADGSMIARDSTGTVHAYYHMLVTKEQSAYSRTAYIIGHRIAISPDWNTLTDDSVLSVAKHSYWSGTPSERYTYRGTTYLQGCDNSARVQVLWDLSEIHGHTSINYSVRTNIILDNAGRYGEKTDSSIERCLFLENTQVRRLEDTTISRVVVSFGDRQDTLSAPVGTLITQFPQTDPLLFVEDGKLLCTWRHKAQNQFSDILASWEPAIDGSTRGVDTFSISYSWPCSISMYNETVSSSTNVSTQFLQGSDLALIGSTWHTMTQARGGPTPGSVNTTSLFCGGSDVLAATATGWTRRFVMSASTHSPWFTPPFTHAWRSGDVVAYDPNRREIIARSIYWSDHKVRFTEFYRLPADSGQPERLDSLQGDFRSVAIVPVEGRTYLKIDASGAALFDGSKRLQEYPEPRTGENRAYRRLLGAYFLESERLAGDTQTYSFRLFDLECNEIARLAVRFPGIIGGPAIAQNPHDSSLGIVWRTADGIDAIHLDRYLKGRGGKKRLSSTTTAAGNPSAAFREDTLHVVWEDTRNGGSDIYGTSITQEQLGTATVPEPVRRGTISLLPNPATDRIVLELRDLEGEVEIEIINLRGELARAARCTPDAVSRCHMDLESLPAGFYLLHYRSGNSTGALPLRIAR